MHFEDTTKVARQAKLAERSTGKQASMYYTTESSGLGNSKDHSVDPLTVLKGGDITKAILKHLE